MSDDNLKAIKYANNLLDRTCFNFCYYQEFRKNFGKGNRIEKLDTDEKKFLRETIDNNLFMTIINIAILYDEREWPKGNEVLSFFQIAKTIGYDTFKEELEQAIEKVSEKIKNIKKYRTKILAHVDYNYCLEDFIGFKKEYKFSYKDLEDLINIGYNIINVLKCYNNGKTKKLTTKINEHTQYKQKEIVKKIINGII